MTSSPQGIEYRDLTGRVRKSNETYIACGGFSEVFEGTYHDETGRQRIVAIKVLRANRTTSDMQNVLLRRLNREARLWHSLQHPNVLEFLGVALNFGPSVALVAPYCRNGHVLRYIKGRPQASRHLILGVAKGLEHLHSKNVIHGDIKGHNILVADDGSALLCDFGRSRIIHHTGFTTKDFAATLRYLAPELIEKGSEVPENEDGEEGNFNLCKFTSRESDVYSFSMVGVEILTGKTLYPRIRNNNSLITKVPNGLRPSREDYTLSNEDESVWKVLELCWVANPKGRLTMTGVVNKLSSL